MHLDNVLRERLQNSDKQEAIDLYYELLSSGHSVGEILESLGDIQCKSEHGNITTEEPPPSGLDGTAPKVTSEAALIAAAQANTRRTPGLTAPLEEESCRIEEPRATESASPNELESGDWEQLRGESLPESEPDIVRSAAVHTSVGSEIAVPSRSQEPLRPGKFSNSAKRIAFGALYTAAVASASIASFAIVSGSRNADPTTTRIQSGLSSGTEAVAIPGLTAGRSETVVKTLKPDKQVVNADTSPVPEPSRSAEPGSAVPGPLQRDAAKMPATFSASTAHIGQAVESGGQAQASAINNRGAVELETGRSGDVSVRMAKKIAGQQIVRAFYTAVERGNAEAASLLVIPERREAGPLSAGELSNFYGRLELPFRLIRVDRAGEDLYNVAYRYKVRNGRPCNGRSLVKTISLQNQILIEGIQNLSGC